MATLEIDGMEFEAIGHSFTTASMFETPLGGGDHEPSLVTCFIAATIRIPATDSCMFDPPSRVRLTLHNGRAVHGDGLVDVSDGTVRGDLRHIRFAGAVIHEE